MSCHLELAHRSPKNNSIERGDSLLFALCALDWPEVEGLIREKRSGEKRD